MEEVNKLLLQVSGIEAEVCREIATRQQLGIKKYGTTVADNQSDLRFWLNSAFEEAIDQAIYLKRAIAEIDAKAKINSHD